MNKLLMLIGVPCSGKSTFLKQLANYTVISSDNLIEEYANSVNKTYNEVFVDYVKTAEKLMYNNAMQAIANNEDIVWDQTNLNKKTRAKKLILFPENYSKIAIVFNTPPTDILNARLSSRPGKNIPVHVMDSMLKSMEIPSEDEGFDKIIFQNQW